MSSWYSIKLKLSNFLYRNIFYRLGYGRPDKRSDWEAAYAGGYWDHLESEHEAQRYKLITRLVKNGKISASVLDVGCGKGILYQYLKQSLPPFNYLGIDISENAVNEAKKRFPEAIFRQMDFDKEELDQKFDFIIFNETLEYFIRPLDKLNKISNINLLPGGRFIISMYKGHEGIWNTITPHFTILEDIDVRNEKGQSWKIKMMEPINND
jgi:2-polyprenyl-3-methyl-5-hydroxy-6-metoxy-1,4-benzoquinol methylase